MFISLQGLDIGRGFLLANGALYLVLAAWCTFAPKTTSAALGFQLAHDGARSEYLVVYGGLELGMAAFFALCGLNPKLRYAGLLFAALTYVALALYRTVTVATLRPEGKYVYFMLATEVTLAVASTWLLWSSRQPE